MDKGYTHQELSSYTVDKLKTIARELNIKTTGRKEELINNILDSQTTYLDIIHKL